MEALPAVPPGRLQQIRELQTTLLQRLGPPTAHPVQCPPDLEQRRVELLTHHLGFTPQPPLPPAARHWRQPRRVFFRHRKP